MRAVFIQPTLTVGGAERQLALLVPALPQRGIVPAIVTLKHRGRFFEELAEQGFSVQFAAMRSRADLRGALRALRLVRATQPDIVITQSIDAQVIGHGIARRLGVPHLTVEHAGPGLKRALHRRVLLRLIAPRVDGVVAVTAAQLPTLAAFGFASDRVTVVPNGTPEPVVQRGRDSVRAELGVPIDQTLVLLAAALRPEKRAALFVEAVAHARGTGVAIHGIVAGSGPDLARVEARARELGGTHVLGDRGDVPDLIQAADIVCLTSSAEGLPMIVLEAMALARPVVSTAVGGLPEVISRETGVLVESPTAASLGDALADLARRPASREAMGRAGRLEYERRFTADRMVDGYAAVIESLVRRWSERR